jgi:tagatose-6-phosphate ketose/aldose isomerase
MDLLHELRADGVAARVLALHAGAPDVAAGDASANDIAVPRPPGTSDLELCFPYIVFAQTLAFLQSLNLGLRPDLPNARGVVSRVVQGVPIYPWDQPH